MRLRQGRVASWRRRSRGWFLLSADRHIRGVRGLLRERPSVECYSVRPSRSSASGDAVSETLLVARRSFRLRGTIIAARRGATMMTTAKPGDEQRLHPRRRRDDRLHPQDIADVLVSATPTPSTPRSTPSRADGFAPSQISSATAAARPRARRGGCRDRAVRTGKRGKIVISLAEDLGHCDPALEASTDSSSETDPAK